MEQRIAERLPVQPANRYDSTGLCGTGNRKERIVKTEDIKQRLVDLGAEPLADALIELERHTEIASHIIQNLIASADEKLARFNHTLDRLKRSDTFYDWRETSGFAAELEMLLRDLKTAEPEPLTGLKCVAGFFKLDESILSRCDDSDGTVGQVFQYDARELLIEFATACRDTEAVLDSVIQLADQDEFGVRQSVFDHIGECLPEPAVRQLIETFQRKADARKDVYKKRHFLNIIESLAEQICDARLFEETRIASWGELSTAAYIDIARVYLAAGDIATARDRLEKIADNDRLKSFECDILWKKIYQMTGETDQLVRLLNRAFQSSRSVATFNALLDVIGHDRRDDIVVREIPLIFNAKTLENTDLAFLLDTGRTDDAERYLLERAGDLNGDLYYTLRPIAETFEAADKYLAATLIYRCLLVSILERGYAKAYPHGVRYLENLDALSRHINDWAPFESHQAFKDRIGVDHKRKRSFWSKYCG